MGAFFIPCATTIFLAHSGYCTIQSFFFDAIPIVCLCLLRLEENFGALSLFISVRFIAAFQQSSSLPFTVFPFHLINLYFFRLEIFFLCSEDCCKLVTDGLIASFLIF
ncbi:ubiquitin carrier protein 7 [Zea mays]|uniref:Ubiquitin carrier protein 7 n=1 Tax=Zea mays TaxID=4577 RepID=A0A1D6K7A7_MAIZE|nr:ubiquitin carrier protein 7 [Zea mays]ONL99393.1 ubiquitin carrier protein 7 [Zea mays]ONL99394.1 ubiquitin carrier protein 7 [Zea mays]ONL99397.1 ubiquitin carrier protein 7 [Zea mays]ONL99399.1 ubiquitin carrier protein 7 [Zea mays]